MLNKQENERLDELYKLATKKYLSKEEIEEYNMLVEMDEV